MEACHKTIGSLADMLPSNNIEDIIETIILNNFAIVKGSKAEMMIKEYTSLLFNEPSRTNE
tara:strand:- start:491 stop:673 length:183 start_codon:yes stop_codon:yes gene_type:complete